MKPHTPLCTCTKCIAAIAEDARGNYDTSQETRFWHGIAIIAAVDLAGLAYLTYSLAQFWGVI
ncbi:MAG: hypothetical protein ACC644_05830 [Candidatus Hydrothermarchaeales archaeon]